MENGPDYVTLGITAGLSVMGVVALIMGYPEITGAIATGMAGYSVRSYMPKGR